MAEASVLQEWLTAYAAQAARDDEVARFVGHIDGEILAVLPQLGTDPVLARELHASTRSQWVTFLNVLPRPEMEVQLPPQAVDLTLSIARRGHDIGVLLKIYRVASQAVWDFLTELVADMPPDSEMPRMDFVFYFWGRANSWINTAVEQLIEVYGQERQRLEQDAFARRAETIRAVLAGDLQDPDTASSEMGHSVRGFQTGFALWVEDPDASADTRAGMQTVADSLASTLEAGRPLTLSVSAQSLWVWVATRTPPDLAAALGDLLDEHPEEIKVSVGYSGRGIEGFRQSHREAVAAQRVTMASGKARRVTFYRDVELLCLAAEQDPALRALAARELGELAGPAKNLVPIRAALHAFLAHGGNVEAAADVLHVHKNTVRYRLARAEELVGRPLTERRAQLEIALGFVDEFGPLS